MHLRESVREDDVDVAIGERRFMVLSYECALLNACSKLILVLHSCSTGPHRDFFNPTVLYCSVLLYRNIIRLAAVLL